MERRDLILLFIYDYISKHSFAPTIREIGEAVDLKSSSTTHGHVTRLLSDGLIDYVKGSSRTLQVTENGKERVSELKERG